MTRGLGFNRLIALQRLVLKGDDLPVRRAEYQFSNICIDRDWMTSAVKSCLLPYVRRYGFRDTEGHTDWRRWGATPSACFDGSREANGNLEVLSATSGKYSFLASDLGPRLINSIPRTYQGWIALPPVSMVNA